MAANLLKSYADRESILNNPFAIKEAQKAIGFKGILFDGQYFYTKDQVSRFFEVTDRTVERYLEDYDKELKVNGYDIFTGERLQALKNTVGSDMNVGTKSTQLGLFNFRSFLNLSMLLNGSERARTLRGIILDIVIDVVNKKSGGSTKFINQRDETYLIALYKGESYRQEFVDALKNCVDMGNAKYAIYTNKVYYSIFKEKAQEYRKVLKLDKKEDVRETMYSEVIELISSFETGFAEELQLESARLKRKLETFEVDDLYKRFENKKLWLPLKDRARVLMASRDNHFRDVIHENLKEYIAPVGSEDFERFLGEKSKELGERIEEYKDVFKRLKDR